MMAEPGPDVVPPAVTDAAPKAARAAVAVARAAVAVALGAATRRLDATSETPRLDAELLLAHALGVDRERLLLDGSAYVVPDGFAALIDRRANHEPVAYIVGYKDFWTIRLAVGPGVLIPRPDSEILIEAAIEAAGDGVSDGAADGASSGAAARFGAAGPATILDLGTGPGTLLLAALDHWPAARGIGVDTSATALSYATMNAAALGMADRATFVEGCWADAITDPSWRADLVLCNPPYVGTTEPLPASVRDFEPAEALFAGADGLDDYRAIMPRLHQLLAPGGTAIFEIGASQRDAVCALATGNGFTVRCYRDLGGRDRALVCSAA